MNNNQLSVVVGVVATFGLLIGTFGVGVNAGIDINAEVNRIEANIGKLKAPPELINAVLHQFQTQCQKNRTIDQSLLDNMTNCMSQHFNETQLMNDIKESIPAGKLDSVFHNMCVKWPKVKECVNEFFVVIDDCWKKGDQVIKFVDGFVKFFCGNDNDGARIALFFAEGGMKCLEDHGDNVKKCIEEKIPDNVKELDNVNLSDPDDIKQTLENFKPGPTPTTDEICTKLGEVRDCAAVGLKKCNDSTPENLITAMLKEVGKNLECQLKDHSYRSMGASFATSVTAASSSLLLIFGIFSLAATIFR